MPPLWKPAAKPARVRRGLEAVGFHTVQSHGGGLTYESLTKGVSLVYSIGVGPFYVVKANGSDKWSRNCIIRKREICE